MKKESKEAVSAAHPLPQAAAHFQIAHTARGLAEATYQEFARKSPGFWAANPDEHAWVDKSWPLFCEQARATLAQLLSTPISDLLREQIAEALILDNDLRGTRAKIQVQHS